MNLDARRATADTELLGDPTCRRFLMCLWHRAGATLTVTPTVADELVGNVRQSERRHWERTLRYDTEHGNRTYDDATWAHDALETLKDPATRFATARGTLPHQARATEARRVTETRAAARRAGYIELDQ